jgi:hypothetical protein
MIWKITNYLGRYLYRPPIAESRITNYNQEDCTISITYQHKQPKETRHATIDVLEFIGNLFRHIPDKYFHMVQY